MNLFKQISVLFFAMMFLMSSTGIVIFESHCSCTGNESVSIYITPETCDENFHVHHSHDSEGNQIETVETECHECSTHMNDCGCSEPNVKYLKLVNQIIDEEVKFVKVQSNPVFEIWFATNLLIEEYNFEKAEIEEYTDPPPLVSSSTDFLIQIHQLKIPEIA